MVTQPNENQTEPNVQRNEQNVTRTRSLETNSNLEAPTTKPVPEPQESKYLAGEDFLEPQDG